MAFVPLAHKLQELTKESNLCFDYKLCYHMKKNSTGFVTVRYLYIEILPRKGL